MPSECLWIEPFPWHSAIAFLCYASTGQVVRLVFQAPYCHQRMRKLRPVRTDDLWVECEFVRFAVKEENIMHSGPPPLCPAGVRPLPRDLVDIFAAWRNEDCIENEFQVMACRRVTV